jgi:tRNA dimethylallyltransferase
MVDITQPGEPFSLGDWLDRARAALDEVWSRDRLPFVAGGTGQYIWALLEGWQVPRVPAQPQLREQLEQRALHEGVEVLAAELQARDPEAALRVDARNPRRVIRALEVLEATGMATPNGDVRQTPDWETLIVGLSLPRDELYRRIDQRVDAMIEGGLQAEARGLLQRGYGPELPAMSSIGYRQMCQYLAGEIDLPAAVERMKTETHRFVRHQNNWFKPSDARIHWLRADADPLTVASTLVRDFAPLEEPAAR